MLYINDTIITTSRFPDGTLHIELPDRLTIKELYESKHFTITWRYTDDRELFQLICLTRKMQEMGYTVSLYMPYIPNARMDRVKEETEIFTLKYFAEIINSLNFEKVTVLDAHSNVSLALIDRIECLSPCSLIQKTLNTLDKGSNLIMFFPDEGAMKRYSGIAKTFHTPYAFGIKKRDWKTGTIQGLDLAGATELLNGRDVLIVDDICSRGGTFYHSAKALKAAGANGIYLCVSHCEETILQGELITSGLVKQVFTTDSILSEKRDTNPVITCYPLSRLYYII